MMKEINIVYMTAGSLAEARTIGKSLVKSKLAACVNIIDNMSSVYWWEGKIQEDKEVVLIAKTTRACVPELIEEVKLLHSDDCPCIVALAVDSGNIDFLNWIAEETA